MRGLASAGGWRYTFPLVLYPVFSPFHCSITGMPMRFSVSRFFVLLVIASFAVVGLSGCESGEETVTRLVVDAEKGDVRAMLKIAELYCGGSNMEQDDQTCGIWMRRAAEGGNRRAQFMLGGMYEQGLGMRADVVQAYRWYRLSAEQGYEMGGTAAKKLEGLMISAQMNQSRKLIEESKAAREKTGRYFVADR
jgi:hypothetical protein